MLQLVPAEMAEALHGAAFTAEEHWCKSLRNKRRRKIGIASRALTGTPLTLDKPAATWLSSPCQPITSRLLPSHSERFWN